MFIVDKNETKSSKGQDPTVCVCVVESLHENGQAKRYGVQLQDEIYSIPDDHLGTTGTTGNKMKFNQEQQCQHQQQNLESLSSDQIKTLSQSSKRPIKFLVRRYSTTPTKKSNKNKMCSISSSLDSHNIEVKDKDKEKDKEKKPLLKNNLTKKEIELALAGKRYPTIPCCRKCNGKAGNHKSHHYLCPKHRDFDGSGAKDKLVIIIAGIRDGCQACKYEFEYGKKYDGSHTAKCGRSDTSNVARTCSTNQGNKRQDRKILEQKKLTKKVNSNSKGEKKKEKLVPDLSGGGKRNPQHKEESKKRKAPERKGLSMSNKSHKSHRTSRQREETKKTPEPVKCDIRPPLHLTDDFSESHWVSCPNPWGNRAHGDGDFVLLSPDCYRVAYESQGHNPPRFVMNPFESENSQYYRTHKCPQEGYRVLQLTRDTLALRSWGFEFNCHDFGGACLVTEVEPLSPAAAAVRIPHPLFHIYCKYLPSLTNHNYFSD